LNDTKCGEEVLWTEPEFEEFQKICGHRDLWTVNL